jgi:outer membrane protein assembly factor BamB
MRIDKLGTPQTAFIDNQALQGAGNKEEPVPLREDGFSPTTGTAPSRMNKIDASAILNARGLDKQDMDYHVKSFDTAPDGTAFVAYYAAKNAEGEGRHPGYISRVSPQGEILWEAPVDDREIYGVKAGADGTAFVQTREHLKAFNPDGTIKFDHTFDEPVSNHFLDSSGNHYFVSNASRELYIVDREGKKADVPEAMKGVKSHQMLQTSPDELYARDGNTITGLDLKSGAKTMELTYKDPVEKKDNFSRYIDHFEVDDKGKVKLWITNSWREAAPPMYDDFHFGLGIGGFHRWGGRPHPPMDDYYPQDRYINDKSVEQIDESGAIVWKAENLGSDPTEAMLPDGTVLYTNNREEMVPRPPSADPQYVPSQVGNGQIYVGKISPEGKKEDQAFKVEGRIRRMLVDKETGTVVMCHGKSYDETVISEFNDKGEVQRTQALPKSEKSLYPESLSGKNRVILKDSDSKKAYSLDMDTGTLTSLTETDMDHSYKVMMKEMESEEEPKENQEAPQGSEEFDGWISIGGVKLPKGDNHEPAD